MPNVQNLQGLWFSVQDGAVKNDNWYSQLRVSSPIGNDSERITRYRCGGTLKRKGKISRGKGWGMSKGNEIFRRLVAPIINHTLFIII